MLQEPERFLLGKTVIPRGENSWQNAGAAVPVGRRRNLLGGVEKLLGLTSIVEKSILY